MSKTVISPRTFRLTLYHLYLDKKKVRKLYKPTTESGFKSWLNEEGYYQDKSVRLIFPKLCEAAALC